MQIRMTKFYIAAQRDVTRTWC